MSGESLRGDSKLFIERALRAFETAYGLKWVALRYFNAAGADPANENGERHDPETHLIPLTIETALGHRTAATIPGRSAHITTNRRRSLIPPARRTTAPGSRRVRS